MTQFSATTTEARRRSLGGRITGGLNRRRLTESDAQPRVYVRPGPSPGLHVVRHECNDQEVTVAGPVGRTWAPGSHVFTARWSGDQPETIIAEPPPGRRGASLVPADARSLDLDILAVTSASPPTAPANSTTATTFSGIGFLQSPLDSFTPVRLDALGEWETDPNITLSNIVWVSSSSFTADVTYGDVPEHYPLYLLPERS